MDSFCNKTLIFFRKMILPNILALSLLLIPVTNLYPAPAKIKEATNYNSKGIKLGEEKKYEDALAEFQRALTIYEKGSAQTLHNKGWVYEQEGRTELAIQYYEAAIKRNPNQLPTYIKLGNLYYLTGKYDRAVAIGEHVITKDPQNAEVLKWLPDAYRQKLIATPTTKTEPLIIAQNPLLMQPNEKPDIKNPPVEEKKEPAAEQDKKKEEPKTPEANKPPFLSIYGDFYLRTGFYYPEKDYKYISTPGYVFNFPFSFNVNANLSKLWILKINASAPYYGASSPNLLKMSESAEAAIQLGPLYVGGGIIAAQYTDNFNFAEDLTLYDFKVGFIFGYKKEKSDMTFTFYPRLIPFEGSFSSGKGLDIDKLDIMYWYHLDDVFGYFSKISINDFYYFNHDTKRSNYYGIYDISFGFTLGSLDEPKLKIPMIFTIDFTKRFYLQDIDNSEPYGFFRGQGWFGLNIGPKDGRSYFSSIKSSSNILSFKAEERIYNSYYLYQKLYIEIVGHNETHHEFTLQAGGGVLFY